MRMTLWMCAAAACGLLPASNAAAQEAHHYFPHEPGTAWRYNITYSTADTALLEVQRADSVIQVESSGNDARVYVRSNDGPVSRYTLTGDTIKVGPSALGLESVLDVLGIEVDDQAFAELSAFRLTAPIDQPWTIRTDSRRVAVPDDLGLPWDSLDVTLRIRGVRLADAQIATPLGLLDTKVFESRLRLSIRVTIIFPVTLHLIDELVLTSHLAPGLGIVRQHSDSYDVREPLNTDNILLTIPQQDVQMTEFRAAPVVSLDDDSAVPSAHELAAAYPNPFNPTTSIDFQLAEATRARLEVFNMLGQPVSVLVDGFLPVGSYRVEWNAAGTASGTYVVRLIAGDEVYYRRVTLAR